MMILSRCRALFERAEDVSAACLLLIYPTALLATCWVYPTWERYGIRFQVLCNSTLLAMAIVICSRSALNRFVVWFRHSIFIYLLPLWLFGLSLMGWRHGFGFSDAHGQGLISGFLGALCVPFICYAMSSVRSFWVFKVLGLVIVAINSIECIFLGLYSYYGINFNASFTLRGEEFSRIFLNTRDGGAWSVLLIGYVFVLWSNAYHRLPCLVMTVRGILKYSVLLVPAYLLSLLTSSRALFVSVAFALLAVRFSRLMRGSSWVAFFLINAIATVFAFVLRLMIGASVAEASNSAVRLLEVDHARLQMWSAWLKSLTLHPHDWFLGMGFNYVPADTLPPGRWLTNVHNLYLQLLVDSGLLGVITVLISIFFVFRLLLPILRQSKFLSSSICFCLSLFFVYSAVSAIIYWSSGCWITFFVIAVSIGLTTNQKILSYELKLAPRILVVQEKYNLSLKVLAFLSFLAFLSLQIPLVASRYTYLAPSAFIASS